MDIRIVALIVLVGIVGSFSEARSAYVRMRRNGLEESVMEFDGPSRTRRESVDSSTVESTATPKSTASARSTSPAITTKKPDPTTESSSNSDPTTSSTPRSSSTAPKSSPTTDPATTKSEETTATTSAPKKPTDPGKSKSTTAAPAIGSRIDPSKDEPPQSDKKPDSKSPGKQMPSKANPTYPTYPTYPYNPFVGSSYEPAYVSPYGDSTFNSIPGPDGYGWTASSSGGSGMASSFASSGAFGAPNYAKPSINDRGAFVDNTPQAANVPNYINPGGFGYFGGDAPFFDPGFAFPTYDFNGFQQHMQENWRRLQDQIQRQQQQIFDTANRINTESTQGTSSSSSSSSGQSAISSIQLGPGGGYQAAVLNPGAPGVESRFAEELPPPSGGSYGVFTSSSSNTMIGPDGKTVSHKVSTTGVNDNGKIHFRTVEV